MILKNGNLYLIASKTFSDNPFLSVSSHNTDVEEQFEIVLLNKEKDTGLLVIIRLKDCSKWNCAAKELSELSEKLNAV